VKGAAVTIPAARRPELAWRDLVPLSGAERLWELSLSLPWLIASLLFYHHGLWYLGVPCSFFFFLTGLRQSHNAQHSSLGIGRMGHHIMLLLLSLLMLASMHAVRVTHLHHHRHCLDHDDEEAAHAGWPWWKALLQGPAFPVRLHLSALRRGRPRDRAWITLELSLIVLLVTAVAFSGPTALRWHLAAMAVGECFTGFFAVWIVHRGCHAEGQIARTQRGWMKNILSYSMFYHLEHHLWPAVPTCHLPKLAARLDRVQPQASELQVV
jgi:fatty acid desaturase